MSYVVSTLYNIFKSVGVVILGGVVTRIPQSPATLPLHTYKIDVPPKGSVTALPVLLLVARANRHQWYGTIHQLEPNRSIMVYLTTLYFPSL